MIIPDAYAVIDHTGNIVYTVTVSKDTPTESNDWAWNMCHEHINDEINGGAEGAGRWVVRPLTVGAQPQAEQPADPDKCDDAIYNYGVSIGLFDMPKQEAEEYCAHLTHVTGCRHDWHYIGGRVHVKALSKPQPAPPTTYASGLRFKMNHPDGEVRTVWIDRELIQDRCADDIYETLGSQICHCEPVGETNVVECNCSDRIDEFQVVASHKPEATL